MIAGEVAGVRSEGRIPAASCARWGHEGAVLEEVMVARGGGRRRHRPFPFNYLMPLCSSLSSPYAAYAIATGLGCLLLLPTAGAAHFFYPSLDVRSLMRHGRHGWRGRVHEIGRSAAVAIRIQGDDDMATAGGVRV